MRESSKAMEAIRDIVNRACSELENEIEHITAPATLAKIWAERHGIDPRYVTCTVENGVASFGLTVPTIRQSFAVTYAD